MMDCSAAEGMVTRYINHTLSIDELEDFLEHVESCSSCYDELETYFIVHEAMLQLNEDEAEFGPCILRSCPEVFRDYLHFRLCGIQMLHASLADKQGQEVGSRLVQLKKQEEKIQFLLEGMSKTG